jgi:hypothetical protein
LDRTGSIEIDKNRIHSPAWRRQKETNAKISHPFKKLSLGSYFTIEFFKDSGDASLAAMWPVPEVYSNQALALANQWAQEHTRLIAPCLMLTEVTDNKARVTARAPHRGVHK